MWSGKRTARVRQLPADVLTRARARLAQLNQATSPDDMRMPPGNRLEQLQGDRAGTYSVRISGQWRLCFRWADGAHDVEIVDYH